MRLILVILIITSITGCFKSSKSSLIIHNVSRDTFVLVKANYAPTKIIVKITGDVSDSFIVMNNIKIPGGIVDTLIDTDFYNREYLFKYNSYKAKKGKLVISIEIL